MRRASIKWILWAFSLLAVVFPRVARGQTAQTIMEWPQDQAAPGTEAVGDTLEFPVYKHEFNVSSRAGERAAHQFAPAIAVDSCGHYALAWVDDRNGEQHIYIQFYDENDQPIGLNQRVSDAEIRNADFTTPVVATNRRGDFVVAWDQNFVQAKAQRLNHFGEKIGPNFLVSTVTAADVSRPAIAVREDGTLITVWSIADGPSQTYNTYVQLFHSDGTPYNYKTRLNRTDGGGFRITDMVAADSSGNFVIVFSAGYFGQKKIFLQRFDSSANSVGDRIMVSDSTISTNHNFPAISATLDGRYLIIWRGNGILGRVYDAVSNQFLIPQTHLTSGYPNQGYQQITTNRQNLFFLQWFGGYSAGVYVRILDRAGNLLGDPQVLRRTNGNHFWGNDLKIAARETNFFYTTHERSSNIYLQKFQTDFTPVGPYHKVHDDTTTAMQTSPAVAFNKQGRVQVSWQDRRSFRERVFAQAFDEQFRPLGDNMVLSDRKQRFNHVGGNKIIALPNGNFVHSFYTEGSGWPDSLVLRMINPEGQIISPRVVVDTVYGDYEVYLNLTPDHRILVYYTNYFESGSLYMRSYDFNLNPLTKRQPIMTRQPGLSRYPYTIVPSDSGRLLVAWRYRGDSDTYIRLFNSEGGYESLPAVEASRVGFTPYDLSGIANNSNSYMLLLITSQFISAYRRYQSQRLVQLNWLFRIPFGNFPRYTQVLKYLNHKSLFSYAIGFDLDGIFINDNSRTLQKYRIHQFPQGNKIDYWIYNTYSADIFNNYLFIAYEDGSDYETRLDIRAKVLDISELDFGEETFYPPPEDDLLLQNYPNPFNNRTTIRYELLTPHRVELTVYNAIGQRVATLVSGFKEAGVYLVDFDGSRLPSGIYFCQLNAYKKRVIKMLMIK